MIKKWRHIKTKLKIISIFTNKTHIKIKIFNYSDSLFYDKHTIEQ